MKKKLWIRCSEKRDWNIIDVHSIHVTIIIVNEKLNKNNDGFISTTRNDNEPDVKASAINENSQLNTSRASEVRELNYN